MNERKPEEQKVITLGIKRAVLLIVALVVLTAVAFAVVNRQMTHPHERGPNQTLIIGPEGDTEVRAEGCFLREQNWPALHFKAISFTPRIIITPRGSEQHTLKLIMENVSPDMLMVDGATIVERLPAEKKMVVETSTVPSKLTVVEWKLNGTEKGFSFFVLGDNRNTYDVLEKIRQDIIRERPLFVVNTGDLVMNGTREQLLKHEVFANSLPVPYFSVLGNHDIEEGSRKAKAYLRIFGPTYYSFWYGPFLFVFLDNANGYISLSQMQWLNKELKSDQKAKRKFVFAHQPPLDPRRGRHHAMKPLISGAPLLTFVMGRGAVDYFISGHIHTYYEYQKGAALYVICGNAKGGGAEPMPISNYAVFKVSGDKVEHFLRLVGNGKSDFE